MEGAELLDRIPFYRQICAENTVSDKWPKFDRRQSSLEIELEKRRKDKGTSEGDFIQIFPRVKKRRLTKTPHGHVRKPSAKLMMEC